MREEEKKKKGAFFIVGGDSFFGERTHWRKEREKGVFFWGIPGLS